MTKKIKRTLFIASGLVAVLIGLYGLVTLFSPGSYSNAETYELNFSEDKVIIAINKFKKDNLEFNVPRVTIKKSDTTELIDGRNDSTDYWYHFYFYIKNKDMIIKAWTRPSTKDKTTFAFVAINRGLNLGNWAEINNNLRSKENEELKEIFKETILKGVENNLR